MKKLLLSLAVLCAVGLTACSSDKTVNDPIQADITPTSAQMFVNGQNIGNTDVTLTRGTTARMEVKFYNAAGNEITSIENSNVVTLLFNPSSFATVTSVSGHNFTKDVVSNAPSGTHSSVIITIGKDLDNAEHSFGPFDIAVK